MFTRPLLPVYLLSFPEGDSPVLPLREMNPSGMFSQNPSVTQIIHYGKEI
jgi:hypothetical protein